MNYHFKYVCFWTRIQDGLLYLSLPQVPITRESKTLNERIAAETYTS